MKLEKYYETYMPLIMKSLKHLAEIERTTIMVGIQEKSSHHNILELKNNIDSLANCVMLLNEYPACDICFHPECTSDHK